MNTRQQSSRGNNAKSKLAQVGALNAAESAFSRVPPASLFIAACIQPCREAYQKSAFDGRCADIKFLRIWCKTANWIRKTPVFLGSQRLQHSQSKEGVL